MNSKILAPEIEIGAIKVKNLTGGEIKWEEVIPNKVEALQAEDFEHLSTQQLRDEVERCKKELNISPKQYQVINGVVKKNMDCNQEAILELRNRIYIGLKILNRRKEKVQEHLFKVRKIDTNAFKSDMIKKQMMIKSLEKRQMIKSLEKDIVTLHESGRLGILMRGENYDPWEIKLTKQQGVDINTLNIEFLIKNKAKFFVFLPEGGQRTNKEYDSIPMKSIKGNMWVPINQVKKLTLKPEIHGKNRKAREYISHHRGSTKGFVPIYEYNEEEVVKEFIPELLSFNQSEYTDKFIVLLGTVRRINLIRERIDSFNKDTRNGWYNFTDQKIIPYMGQTSRCINQRVVVPEEGRVQVFGLDLKGTPEEGLKNYLRSFSRGSSKRENPEVKELIEIAHEQDGRQTIFNIEYDLRNELKHLRTRSSKELFSLLYGVEESLKFFKEKGENEDEEAYKKRVSMNKKEIALVNVLKSFKSSREIEEEEGKGLTSDIEDLVTIEENSNDDSYKKMRNLYSMKDGLLSRNQNPLNMGDIEELSDWTIKGGPISFPTNEILPKRNIKFVQRVPLKTMELPRRTMFIRKFTPFKNAEKTEKRISLKNKEAKRMVVNHVSKVNIFDFVINHPVHLNSVKRVRELTEKIEKRIFEEEIAKKMKLPIQEDMKSLEIINFKEIKGIPTQRKPYKTLWEQYVSNNGRISTVRIFDEKYNPGQSWKEATWKQFLASKQQSYQFSGKIVFDKKKHEFVRIPHNKPSSFKILHTIGKEGDIDYYIIKIGNKRLFAKGDISLLNKESVSFTGTRNPSDTTKNFVKESVRLFLEDDDYVTIGGGAEGCDTIMARETIKRGGKTIMVLAGGFNQWFKKEQIKPNFVLKNGGLILSEHEPKYRPNKSDFVKRNEIIAGLSEKLVVFEPGNGTIHCAKFGSKLKRKLLAQPGCKNSELIEKMGGRFFLPIEGYYPF